MINDKRGKNSTAHGRKDSGVSEIIGDILILGITVVLFTSIFFYVNAIPTPTAQTYADFQATVTQPIQHGLTFQEILNITHLGGQNLNSGTTSIVVQINQTTFVYQLPEGNSVETTGALGPWTQSQWETNQVWSINQTGITSGAVVAVSIINTASNYVVWSTVLTGKSNIATLVIQSAYASPSPVTPGKKLTVTAVVLGNVKYVNASVYYLNTKVGTMALKQSEGVYTGNFNTSISLVSGQYYPIQINATSPNGQKSNYSFSTLVANNGPDIITASVNPNPATPGSYFNITAYIVDPNVSQFNPASGFGRVTVAPYGTPILTNITQGSNISMVQSAYLGIFTYPGRVNLNVNGYETFVINATDTEGNEASYFITIVVLNTLNPGFLNSSYPSTYLGPASMTYSNFKWYEAGHPTSPVTGYAVSSSIADNNGIYFQLELANHNTSASLYLDDLTNIYMFGGASAGFAQFASFIVLNATYGATYLTPTTTVSGYQSNTYTGSSYSLYPSLAWQPAKPWSNYTITNGGESSTSFVMLPAAVGGVQVSVNVMFGAGVGGKGSGFASSVPATGGGAFGPFSGSSTGPTQYSITASFLELFGYLLPYQVMPWKAFPTSGVAYGQTIPFSGIYWY